MTTLATTLPELKEARVTTKHAFTGRMCAASRDVETKRPDSLFVDPLAHKLAGTEGRGAPMGSWILVPRTRRGDDCLVEHYGRGCRQLVLLGAGMDARAYRAFAPGADAPPDARSPLTATQSPPRAPTVAQKAWAASSALRLSS